jgi:murein L,D-transpeptidase YcbB/YkuD
VTKKNNSKQGEQLVNMLMRTVANITKMNEQLIASADAKLGDFNAKLLNLNKRLEALEGVTTDGTTNEAGNGETDRDTGGSEETCNRKLH